ncbi:MAG: FxLYD domain-containing protein [Acidobacteriota bacterium]
MKKLMAVLALALAALAAEGAVVVFKGGKRLEVSSFEQKGSFVVVTRGNGRVESYPLNSVDMNATRDANNIPAPASASSAAKEPRSLFRSAVAQKGEASAVITDADVSHPAPVEEGETATSDEEKAGDPGANVALITYDRRRVGDGQWELVATVANQGTQPASGVTVEIKFVGADNEVLGSGSGTYPGNLAPQQQGSVTVKVASPVEPARISADLRWQTIREVPATPAPSPTAAPSPRPAGTGSAAAAKVPSTFGIAEGSSPSAVPSNPLAFPNVTQVRSAPQVPPPPPPAT